MATEVVNLSSDSLKVLLLTSYTYADSQATITNVLAAGTETSGTGYIAGGMALTSVSVSTTGLVTTINCANVVWATAAFSAAYAIFYDAQGGTNSTSYPFTYWDFGGSVSATAGTFQLTINASGLATLTSS